MTKLMAMVAASLVLCGCSDWDDLPPSRWEYQVALPAEATTEALAETEARLRSNGYVRVRFRTAFNEWNGRPIKVLIFATRTPGKETNDGGER